MLASNAAIKNRSTVFALMILIKVVAVLILVLGTSLVLIYAELKLSAHIQSRIGPWYVGGRWGWAHPLAEAVKFLQKEDLVPAAADSMVYRLAPYIVLMATTATYVIIPFGPDLIAEDDERVRSLAERILRALEAAGLPPDESLISTGPGSPSF